MIYDHFSEMPWDAARWPNFTPQEMACRHCGEAYYDPLSFDMIQAARRNLGGPIYLNCAHRCAVHNAHVGGAPLSQHKLVAFDLSVRRTDPAKLFDACQKAGFSTFGFYGTFLHTDIRPGRRWATKAGRKTWNFLLTS